MDKALTLSSESRLSDLIFLFEKNKDSLLSAVYESFRNEYMSFSKKYCDSEEMRLDSFQEAVIGLYENLTQKKIKRDDALIKTYLFSIGKNKLMNAINKTKRESNLSESMNSQNESKQPINRELLEALAISFDQLGDRCKEVLMKFYYHRYSIEAIAHDMEYKNQNTVKAHKSRCISQLRKILRP